MKTTVLTKSNVFIIGPVATLLGFIINALYLFLSGAFNIQNIGLCIILFTIVINVLMLPLTIKQQKSSKLTQVMNPELQAIAKKYKNKKDQASMMKMQEEQQAVYAKYGISPMGSCLPMLIPVSYTHLGSAYLSRISSSSFLITPRSRFSSARIAFNSEIFF